MKLGKVIFKEIPQIEVIGTKRDGLGEHTYYLSPFRAYGFQVSHTNDGQWNAGRSEFVGLRYIVKNNDELIAKALFRALVLNALMDHNKGQEAWYPDVEEWKKIDEFVNASYDWVQEIRQEEVVNRVLESSTKKKQSITDKIKSKLRKQA